MKRNTLNVSGKVVTHTESVGSLDRCVWLCSVSHRTSKHWL